MIKSLRFLVILCVLFVGCLRADEFKLKPAEVGDLIVALSSLNGYEHSVDQGPGNPAKVVTEPFTFSAETRAKLGANLHALKNVWKSFQDRLSAIRVTISGNPDSIDVKVPAQVSAWQKATLPMENEILRVDLSPITADELTVNKNPIPITVLGTLNRLRPLPVENK